MLLPAELPAAIDVNVILLNVLYLFVFFLSNYYISDKHKYPCGDGQFNPEHGPWEHQSHFWLLDQCGGTLL